jgi:hypothetical protein
MNTGDIVVVVQPRMFEDKAYSHGLVPVTVISVDGETVVVRHLGESFVVPFDWVFPTTEAGIESILHKRRAMAERCQSELRYHESEIERWQATLDSLVPGDETFVPECNRGCCGREFEDEMLPEDDCLRCSNCGTRYPTKEGVEALKGLNLPKTQFKHIW